MKGCVPLDSTLAILMQLYVRTEQLNKWMVDSEEDFTLLEHKFVDKQGEETE